MPQGIIGPVEKFCLYPKIKGKLFGESEVEPGKVISDSCLQICVELAGLLVCFYFFLSFC